MVVSKFYAFKTFIFFYSEFLIVSPVSEWYLWLAKELVIGMDIEIRVSRLQIYCSLHEQHAINCCKISNT